VSQKKVIQGSAGRRTTETTKGGHSITSQTGMGGNGGGARHGGGRLAKGRQKGLKAKKQGQKSRGLGKSAQRGKQK